MTTGSREKKGLCALILYLCFKVSYNILNSSLKGQYLLWTNPMQNISKGQLEDKISKKFIQFERDFLGRGPVNVKTDIIRDMILITLQGVLTRAEIELAKDLDGILMVKSMRSKLLENGKHHVSQIISEVTGSNIISMHTDISTKSGERVILLKVDKVLFG
jgi:uncharacterized protein YbcI